MSTVQKITSFVDLPDSIKNSHYIRMAISHDIMLLQNFAVQCNDVELLNDLSYRLTELIKNINDYENKCKKSISGSLASN